MEPKKERLGIDIGGVIIDRGRNQEYNSLFRGNDYLEVPAVEGVFCTLFELVERKFGKEIFLLSKCGEETEKKTRHWFRNFHFFALTDVSSENVYFCRERKQKADICKELEITHFIDDQLEILGYLFEAGIKNLFLFQPCQEEIFQFSRFLPFVFQAESWQEVLEKLLKK